MPVKIIPFPIPIERMSPPPGVLRPTAGSNCHSVFPEAASSAVIRVHASCTYIVPL